MIRGCSAPLPRTPEKLTNGIWASSLSTPGSPPCGRCSPVKRPLGIPWTGIPWTRNAVSVGNPGALRMAPAPARIFCRKLLGAGASAMPLPHRAWKPVGAHAVGRSQGRWTLNTSTQRLTRHASMREPLSSATGADFASQASRTSPSPSASVDLAHLRPVRQDRADAHHGRHLGPVRQYRADTESRTCCMLRFARPDSSCLALVPPRDQNGGFDRSSL